MRALVALAIIQVLVILYLAWTVEDLGERLESVRLQAKKANQRVSDRVASESEIRRLLAAQHDADAALLRCIEADRSTRAEDPSPARASSAAEVDRICKAAADQLNTAAQG